MFLNILLWFPFSSAHVSRHVNFVRKFRNINFKSTLHLFQYPLICFTWNEWYCNTFGSKTPCTSNAMEKLVAVIRKVIVDNNIDPFNINTTPKQISCDQDSGIEFLEWLLFCDALFLPHSRMNTNGRKVTFRQQSVEFFGTSYLGYEDDDLIEFQDIKEVVEFSIFLCFS